MAAVVLAGGVGTGLVDGVLAGGVWTGLTAEVFTGDDETGLTTGVLAAGTFDVPFVTTEVTLV